MRVYELLLSDELKDGINAISVVGSPAMESQFIALKKQEKVQHFAGVDQSKKILMGIVMKPNKRIYRKDDETGEEYEVFFSADTVRRASELYLKNNKQRNFNIEHNADDLLEAYAVESWIVEDTEKDKSSLYDLGAEVGDWVSTMKFDTEEQYHKALEQGTGFSIEGIFSEKVILKTENKMEYNFKEMEESILTKIKAFFTKEVKLGMIATKDGSMKMEFDGDMPMIGSAISLVTADGNVPLPVGEYELENDMTLTVTEVGVIGELEDMATSETEPADIPTAPATAPTAMDVDGLKNMISSLLVKFSQDIDEKIEAKFSEATKATEDLKVELSAQPAVGKTKVSPNASKVDLSSMTALEKHRYIKEQQKILETQN